MTVAETAAPELSPFEMVGGTVAVRRFVDRFYDLMDADPAYGALRALHASDLGPMRESLAGFLTGWLGGPRDWFIQRPGVCMMSAHARIPINAETAGQWVAAMNRALDEAALDPALTTQITTAFGRMAQGMARD